MPDATDNVVVCVFKSGVFQPRADRPYSVSYGPHHVRWLRDQFQAQCATPHRFVCMSDVAVPGVETLPLQDDLPGWWSKLEIFREFRRAAYVDLDTVLVGDPSKYLFHGSPQFIVSAGIHITRGGAINTSLMCWNGNYRFLYDQFMEARDRIMATYITQHRWGDQGFLKDAGLRKIHFRRFQERFPGSILHYMRDFVRPREPAIPPARPAQPLPDNWMAQPRIVFFNGERKPWDVEEPWIPRLEQPCAS